MLTEMSYDDCKNLVNAFGKIAEMGPIDLAKVLVFYGQPLDEESIQVVHLWDNLNEWLDSGPTDEEIHLLETTGVLPESIVDLLDNCLTKRQTLLLIRFLYVTDLLHLSGPLHLHVAQRAKADLAFIHTCTGNKPLTPEEKAGLLERISWSLNFHQEQAAKYVSNHLVVA